MLKKLTIAFLILTGLHFSTSAQTISNYALTASAGTFTPLTSPTAATLTGTTGEGYYNNIPVGFDYWYMGVRYTSLSASTNGWISMGSAITSATPINNLTTGGAPRPVIAPLWDDLDVQAATNVTYLTSGTPGSRIFTLQVLNARWQTTATGNTISYQLKLYEGTGKIDMIYRSETGTVVSGSASIGITAAATGAGNFLSLDGTGTAPLASSTTETTTLSARPVNGQVYSFLSTAPAAATGLTFSAITTTSMTLGWTDNSTNEVGFLIYRSTDGTNYTFVTQTAANAVSSVQSGLSASTTYYWKIFAMSEGNASAALNGTQVSGCVPATLSGTSTVTCVGGSTGTVTASASGGTTPYTYNINSGTYQASATFTGLAAGTYTLGVKTNAGCVTTTSVTVSPYPASTDDQTATATNSWIGHVYDGTGFTTYIGQSTEPETFNESFGGATVCYSVTAASVARSIYTETFSAKYRMNSTKRGLYVADLGSDDGSRLTVDGTMVCNNWADQSFTSRPSVLFNLTGTSSLLYEFYENAGSNQVVFQNFTLLLANTLSTNTTQSVCNGTTGSAISGDVYGTLPTGITLSGTGYQWTYSTTPGGARTNIAGATGATYSPTAAIAPFNVPGTYYIYRNAVLSSTKNVSPATYVATNESNAATITILPIPSATISYTGSPYCKNGGTASVTRTGDAGGSYSSTTGLTINSATGDVTPGTSTPGTYTVTYSVPTSNGCATFTTTANITITAAPSVTIIYPGGPYCTSGSTATVNRTGDAGGSYSSTTGLSLNGATGTITLFTSNPGTYTVTYTIAAANGCATFTTSTTVTILAAPAISQTPVLNLIANYKLNGDAVDATGTNNGAFQNGPTVIPDRFNIANSAYSFDGISQYMSTTKSYINPATFTLSIWFKTSTVTGGKLIGFGSAQTGQSTQYDRHIYMNNAGQIYFGIYNGGNFTVNSSAKYNDNIWHLATATLSTGGMILYVDGAVVGTNASAKIAENSTGYWKVGYDNLNGWPSVPTSFYFNGSLDNVLIYDRALSASEVSTLYVAPDGAGNNGPVCSASPVTLSATTISGATYAWSGPGGFTSSAQNPSFVYTPAKAGIYTVQVSAGGCTSTAYTTVATTTVDGQWTGNTSTDWTDASNWCSGVLPTSATNVVITSAAARMPLITTTASCNNLTINTGATVITAAAGTLNIAGTLLNSGTMTNSGTTNFNGTSGQQSFSGITLFQNLTVTNAAGLILPAAIQVNGNLTLASGTLNSNNFSVFVAGNWINNASTGAFSAGTSTVNFNGTAAQSISGSFETSFNNITVNTLTNTVSLATNANIAGNLTVTTGTLDLGTFTANRLTPGGIITVDNNSLLKIGGTNTFPSNYASANLVVAGTVEYSGTDQTVSNQLYGNLKLSSLTGAVVKTFPATAMTVGGNLSSVVGTGTSVSFVAAAPVTVNGNISIGAATSFDGGSFTHTINGNWTNNGNFAGNTSTVVFTGAGKSITGPSTGQNFNNLTIAASGITLSNQGLTLTGNLATTGSGAFVQASGGTLTMTGNGGTIAGNNISIDNLSVTGTGKVTANNSFTLTGNISLLNAANTFTGATGTTIKMTGSTKTISGSGSPAFDMLNVTGSVVASTDFSIGAALVVDGSLAATSGNATFTGTSVLSGTANLFNVTENGTKLQLSANSVLGVASLLTITAGALDVTSSVANTVNFNGTIAQYINAITYDNLILSNGNTKTATADLTVNDNFTIASGTTFVPGSFTHNIYGNWTNNGTFTTGSGTVRFFGNSNSTLTGATIFNTLTVDKATSAMVLVLQNNVTANLVNMTQGRLNTSSNTLTITNTRTGPGIILGNIKRTNAFTTGVDYAFESPYNTIRFASVTGITTITVSVVRSSISDFPSGASIARLYTISIPTGTYDATLRLHYEDNELNGNNESTMSLWNFPAATWVTAGASGRDATNNYVEQTGLTNIAMRWTLSGPPIVRNWTGATSNDWNTASNWSTGVVPTYADIAAFGLVTFANQPSINTAITIKNITFGSAKAVTLTMAAGGSLITGDITGTWSGAATHNISAGNQSITINGDLIMSDGTAGDAINLAIGTGTVVVTGSLMEKGNANILFSGAGKLQVGRQFSYTNGTFTAGTGTVEYINEFNLNVAPVPYNNLSINKTAGTATVAVPVTVNGNLGVLSGLLFNNSSLVVKGDVTINAGATLDNDATFNTGGNWNNNGTYDFGTGLNIFDGAGTQSISSTTFNNLTINKPVGSLANLTGDVTMNGNLVGTSGTLDTKSFLFNRDVVGGSATISSNGTLIIGADNAPTKFANYNLAAASTVIFNGTAAQHLALPGLVYGNLIFRNSGTKLLYTPITVMGDLTIESTAIFDAGANNIDLNGNWINNGSFNPATSLVVFGGSNKTVSGNTTFNKATITGSYVNMGDMTYNDLLNITSTGSISSSTGILTTLNGDLTNSGILNTSGTTTFTGTRVQTLSLIDAITTYALIVNFNGTVSPVLNSTTAPQYGFLNINNTGGVNPSVGWTIAYGLTVAPGASFNCGSSSHTIYGNVTNNGTITSSGTISFLPPSNVTVDFGTNFTSTGRVYFGGTGALTIAGTPVSFGTVNINNTNPAGITPVSNWSISKTLRVVSGSVFNAGSYTHSVGGNILNAGTINSGTSTFVLNGAGTQEINTLSAFNNLTLNKTGDSTFLSANMTVNGILNFIKGKIITGNFKTTIAPSGTVSGAGATTGWINGRLEKYLPTGTPVKNFEVGSQQSYTPASLSFANVSTAGNMTLSTTSTDHPALVSSSINPNRSVNRYWTIANNGVSFSSYQATLNFVPSDVDLAATTSAFHQVVYNGSSWVVANTTSALPTSIVATGITGTGDIAVGEICNFGTTIAYASILNCSDAGPVTPVITGSTGGVFSASPGLVINASTGVVDAAASTAGTYTVVYTIAANSDCGQFVTNTQITIGTPGLWTGAVDNNWYNPGNWSCATVPAPTANITIPTGRPNYPVLNTAVTLNDINIQSMASVIVNGTTLTISGNITNSGTFDVSAATITMAGTAGQTIPANAFTTNAVNDLVIQNSIGNVTLFGPVDIYNSLTYSGTHNSLVTNNFLTLKSNAFKTAYFGDATGNTITGKVTVERYVPARKAWRFLSIPTNTTQNVKQSWQENSTGTNSNPVLHYGIQISGTNPTWAADGFDMFASTPAMKTYVPSGNSWSGISNTNVSGIKTQGGYLVFVRGDRTANTYNSVPTATTLRTKGDLYTGTQPSIAVGAGLFGAIGNPYAAPVDMRKITRTNLSEFYYLWDANLGGIYGYGGYQTFSWDGTNYIVTPGGGSYGASGSVNNYIASGAAFFVQAKRFGGAGSIQFTEDVKIANAVVARPAGDPVPSIRTNLYIAAADSSILADGVMVNYDDEYSNSIDDLDAVKTINSAENLGIKNTGQQYIIERRHTITDQDTIYLNIANEKIQQYKFEVLASNMNAPGLTGYLVDNYLHVNTILNMEGSTFYNFGVQNIAASYAADRFRIIFSQTKVLPVTITNVKAYQHNSNINVEWKVENETNIKNYETERSTDGNSFKGFASSPAKANGGGAASYATIDVNPVTGANYYRVKTTDLGGKVTYTNVVKVMMGKTEQGIIVFPNPIVNAVISIQLNNMPAGEYDLTLLNSLGQRIFGKTITHYQGNSTELVTLDRSVVHGIYQLEILKPGGEKIVKQIVY